MLRLMTTIALRSLSDLEPAKQIALGLRLVAESAAVFGKDADKEKREFRFGPPEGAGYGLGMPLASCGYFCLLR
jgi:hypothetical protein